MIRVVILAIALGAIASACSIRESRTVAPATATAVVPTAVVPAPSTVTYIDTVPSTTVVYR